MKKCFLNVSIILLFCFSACSTSRPANFFLLSPVAEVADVQGAFRVGVGPVNLPTYLERPQIVTRKDDAQLSINEYDRWAEPLEETVASVLAVNIARTLGTLHVEIYPFKVDADVSYQVVVDVLSFEYVEDSSTIGLHARWVIQNAVSREVLAREVFRQSTEVSEDIGTQVRTMNSLLGQFSREVAGSIQLLADLS